MIGPILGGSPRIKLGTALNLVCDGNSLTAGAGGYPWPSGLKEQYPEFNTATISNFAVGGQTTQQMIGRGALVDAAWRPDKVNVLVAWEGTNSICNVNRTPAQAIQDMADYLSARLALHPWKVIVGTCLPREDWTQSITDAINVKLDAYNTMLMVQYRSMGATAIFDVRRTGSKFNVSSYAASSFEDSLRDYGFLAADEVGNHIHLSNAGYTHLIKEFIAPVIRRLPAR